MHIFDEIYKLEEAKTFRVMKRKNRYSLLVETERGRSTYYFSCPIYDKKGRLVEASFTEKEKSFVSELSCCRIHVSDGRIELETEKNKVFVETQSDITAEATLNGLKCDCNGNVCRLLLKAEGNYREAGNGRYFALMTEEDLPLVTVSGMFSAFRGGGFGKLELFWRKAENGYELQINANDSAESVSFEIDMYEPKLFFDTTVEADCSDRNNAFGGIAYLSGEEGHEEKLFSRFNLVALAESGERQIEKAIFYIPVYTKNGAGLRLRAAKEAWCSRGLNWTAKIKGGERSDEAIVKNGYADFDVTKLLKAQLRIDNLTDYGVIVSTAEKTPVIISTGDNYYRPQILKIVYKE